MSVTDLSSLSPLDIKLQNLYFLNQRDHEYFLEGGSYEATRRRVMNVRNGDIRRVLRNFELGESIIHQGAWWMRAFVGKHFFPDANHRTAMVTFRYLMDENGISVPPLDIEQVEQATRDSKKVRLDIVDVTLANLDEQDELYKVWCAYFTESI